MDDRDDAGVRRLSAAKPFDPKDGIVVREPLGEGPGWWAGAASVEHDPSTGDFYLYYRYRKPRELGRGVECRIARGRDGRSFEDVWAATKDEIGTSSMEKSCIVKAGADLWRLYLSYVDEDGRWRIDTLEAARPEDFDVRRRGACLTADDCAAEGVKDPAVYLVEGRWHMLVSYAPTPGAASEEDRARMHASGDIYNVGVTKSHTGLATSDDGVRWTWEGDVLAPPEDGWDSYCTRIGAVTRCGGLYVGQYDGSASVAENYEERAGLAVSRDLRTWTPVTVEGPWVDAEVGAEGSVRYVEAIEVAGATYYYYEYTRADGSHELRVAIR